MKIQKNVCLDIEVFNKLSNESNASELITKLLEKHYGITSKD